MNEGPGAGIRKPRRLTAGDTVAVVAPASPWEARSELLRAVSGLEAWGLRVRLGEHVNDRHAYLAGTDQDRAADLNAAWRDPDVRAIVCLQGGYGTARLLPLLDRDAMAAHPKPLCGYSDITLLHLAVEAWSEPGTISFYSNGAAGVGSPEVSGFSKATMHRALFSAEPYGEVPRDPDDPYVRTISGGTARGRLTGGCLGLVRSSLGTSVEIDTTDRILYLEDLDSDAYELDGGLTHLRNAGKLEACAGIVIGQLKGVGWREDRAAFMQDLSVEDVLEEVVGPLGVPCLYGLPIGHGKHHATVPHGAMASLDADAGRLVVEEVVTADPMRIRGPSARCIIRGSTATTEAPAPDMRRMSLSLVFSLSLTVLASVGVAAAGPFAMPLLDASRGALVAAPAVAAMASVGPASSDGLPACKYRDISTRYDALDDWWRSMLDTNLRLNRHYRPATVDVATADIKGDGRVRSLLIPDLAAMARAARHAHAGIAVRSAYRSYRDQVSTFAGWVARSGYKQALKFAARPGHSEHQLGTTIDFRSSASARPPWGYSDWAKTASGRWMGSHAWEYGFILSYPKGKTSETCYGYEPWHFRYVGRDLAQEVHDSGLTLRRYLWRHFETAP